MARTARCFYSTARAGPKASSMPRGTAGTSRPTSTSKYSHIVRNYSARRQVRTGKAAVLLFALAAFGQTPRHYECHRAIKTVTVDGRLNESSWKDAPWSDDFVDIEGSVRPAPRFRTRMKMLWDDVNLYVGAELEEPDIWATLTQHDSI